MENRKDKALEELERQANAAKLRMAEKEKNVNRLIDTMLVDYEIKTTPTEKIVNKEEITSEIISEIADEARMNLDEKMQFYNNNINEKYGLSDIEYESTKLVATEKIDPKKIKKRSFFEKILDPKVLATLAAATVIGIAVAPTIIETIKYRNLNEQEKFVYNMAIEAEIHGGKKNAIDDEFVYSLKAHEESGKCLIQDGEGAALDRIIDTCVEHGLSDEVIKDIVEKYKLNDEFKFEDAEKIDPVKTFKEEQKELKEQNNSYGM